MLPDPTVSLTLSQYYTPLDIASTTRASASVTAATNAVGAFALNTGSQDDALVATLPTGTYTFQLASKSNSTGVALIEIYEVSLAQ